ncbi:competence protein CoiA family protein [Streptomyces sp. NPDC127091]|uniref:competence protein CoiA family protein n=1 Tax=Streptomyces sp. NPDC127091 TaxID=3347134 RepID=UPI0036615336
MPSYEDDTRKVQTAVTGRPGSDQPVFLPFDHDDFDGFMQGRSRDDFYCGALLGGCGKKLTAKRYLHKKCHFAHRPPVHCRRARTGEDSADHLYIGQTLRRWLQQQGHRDAGIAYLDLGSGPGGAVEVRFGQGRRLIRVQLSRVAVPAWEADRARLSDTHTHVQWAYGPHSGLGHVEAEASGHAVRFTCRTESGSRVVYVGTQTPDRTVEWTTLGSCRLTDEGIVTSRTTGAAALHAIAPAVAFLLAPGSVAFTVTAEGTVPDGPTRLLYEADVQPTGSVVVRARISLPRAATPPLRHRLHVLYGTPLLQPSTHPSAEPAWFIRADGFTSLPAPTDARWPDLRPVPAPVRAPLRQQEAEAFTVGIAKVGGEYGHLTPQEYSKLSKSQQRRYWQKVKQRRQADQKAQAASGRPHARSETDPPWTRPGVSKEDVVKAVRDALVSAARRQVCVGWHTLAEAAGLRPADFSDWARTSILVSIDQASGPEGILLSSLVVSSGNAPVPYFDAILGRVGRPSGLRPIELGQVRKTEQARVFAAYAHPSDLTHGRDAKLGP